MQSCCEHREITLTEHASTQKTRRSFLQLAALGAGVTLGSVLPTSTAVAAGHTEALLLSCMDFRLMDEIEHYMSSERKLKNNYDHIVLAGAALGATTDKFPAWNQTFWQHLDVAIKLHNIKKVIVMDHRDCGAYKVILGEDFSQNPKKETAAHTEQLQKLEKKVKEKYPELEVELLLMALDGKVELVARD